MSIATMLNRVTQFVDWFIPTDIAGDRERRKQARMFLYSHIFGPFLGNTVPLALYLLDPSAGYRIDVLFASITGFWLFPIVLRTFGNYNTLAVLSVQNLIFCILWSCYFYGGVTSPTLPWVLTIPLLAFFYVGPSPKLRGIVLAQFAISLGVFYYLYTTNEHAPIGMSLSELQGLGLVSTTAASLYVTMMALFYASALASQVELEFEMREHQITSAQLRVATEEATRAGAAKSDFLAKMSHELRTPLNAVIGYSEILLEEAADDDASVVSDLRKIHGAGHYLLKLINEILDLSKIDAGKMEIFNEIGDCDLVLSQLVDEIKAKADLRGNSLTFSRNAQIGLVYIDFHKVRQILSQLIDNAIKFTSNGEIRVEIERASGEAGDEIIIRVHDTGVGIAKDRFPTLFEQFNIAGDVSATKYGGTGLGLALCKKLCDLLHGDIEVKSELGLGSLFTVRLPAKASNGAKEEDGDDVAAALAAAESHHKQLQKFISPPIDGSPSDLGVAANA